MTEYEQLCLDIVDDKDKEHAIEIVSKLNSILANNGVKFNFDTYGKTHILGIHIDDDAIKKSMKRNAGRKTRFSNVKFSDVLRMQESMTHEQIIENLKMSRATYFRKIKKMNEILEINPHADYYF